MLTSLSIGVVTVVPSVIDIVRDRVTCSYGRFAGKSTHVPQLDTLIFTVRYEVSCIHLDEGSIGEVTDDAYLLPVPDCAQR